MGGNALSGKSVLRWSCGALLHLSISLAAIGETAWVVAADEPVGKSASEIGDWPQFLGPDRNGLSAEKGLLTVWPEGGPKVVWRQAGGVGMSGISVQGKTLVTLVQREDRQWLVAHDARTGVPLWQTDLAPAYENSMGNGPRATPAIAGDRVFVFTGEGILAAVSLKDGKRLWSTHTVKLVKGKEAEYGMASSPLVVGNQVIVIVGGTKSTVVAFDVASGKQVWESGFDPAGYSSPVLLNVGGKPQLVAFSGMSALGIDPATGDDLWRYEFETNFACNIALPIAVKGQVFLSAGENHGSVLLALTPKAKAFEVKEVWSSFGPKSVLRSEWQTPILLDGYLYGMDNVGGAGPVTHLTCVDATTGERKWQVPRFGKGNLMAADGKLFFSTMKGELVVARASPQKYDEMGRVALIETTRQAPTLSRGFLYLRDDTEIVCVDVRKP